MRNFIGTIIGESLADQDFLTKVKIVKTDIEPTTPEHQTPWLHQWTLHTIEVSQPSAAKIAHELSLSLDEKHHWYADFKNDHHHYIVFSHKVFQVDRQHPEQYQPVVEYGKSLGIPEYQLDFSPDMAEWQRKNTP